VSGGMPHFISVMQEECIHRSV